MSKSIQEIANNVQNPADRDWNSRHLDKNAPGKAQQVVLDALQIEAKNFAHANEIFRAIGINVGHKRVGRSSVPVVSIRYEGGGQFNYDGEGEYAEWTNSEGLDLSAIQEWMAE